MARQARRHTRRCPRPRPVRPYRTPISMRATPRSRRRRGERLHTEYSTLRVDRGSDMVLEVNVDPARDQTRRPTMATATPSLSKFEGRHARPGKETVSSRLFSQPAGSPSGTGRAHFSTIRSTRTPTKQVLRTKSEPDHAHRRHEPQPNLGQEPRTTTNPVSLAPALALLCQGNRNVHLHRMGARSDGGNMTPERAICVRSGRWSSCARGGSIAHG